MCAYRSCMHIDVNTPVHVTCFAHATSALLGQTQTSPTGASYISLCNV